MWTNEIHRIILPCESLESDTKSSQNETSGQKPVINDSSTVVPESNKQEIQNDTDCVEDYETSKLILKWLPLLWIITSPDKTVYKSVPFSENYRKRTGLFCYDVGPTPEICGTVKN